jgi:hypothetical protein
MMSHCQPVALTLYLPRRFGQYVDPLRCLHFDLGPLMRGYGATASGNSICETRSQETCWSDVGEPLESLIF